MKLQQRRGYIPVQNILHELRRLHIARQAQHIQNPFGVDGAARRAALVQKAQGITQSAVGQAREKLRRLGQQVQLLLIGHIQQPTGDVAGLDALEGEALAAGEDGGGHLVQLRGGQNENEVGRGLLQNLQQRVECGSGEHVDLVHDVYAVFYLGRGVDGLVPQGADVVHAVVGGGVQLQHIQETSVVNAQTGGTLITGVTVYRMLAVDSLGQDLGAGGLTGTAGTGEEVGVAQPPLGHLTAQSLGDMLLSHHIGKGLGPPLAVKRLIHTATS